MMEYAEKNKVELLSPAGDMERLSAALSFGADAVYLAGREFGMRSAPKNFGEDELCRAAKLCHSYGAKLYLTCNTVPRNEELSRLPGFLEFAQDAGVDAFILTDLGVFEMAKRYAPRWRGIFPPRRAWQTGPPPVCFTKWELPGWFWPGNFPWRKLRVSAQKHPRIWSWKHFATGLCA